MLTERIIDIATKFGIDSLNLQTEDLTGGLYSKSGWKPVQEFQREKLLVLIMEKNLDA